MLPKRTAAVTETLEYLKQWFPPEAI